MKSTRSNFDSYYLYDTPYSSKVELYAACVSLKSCALNISLFLTIKRISEENVVSYERVNIMTNDVFLCGLYSSRFQCHLCYFTISRDV